jgi:glycosyltransferase involved in cell wall biosynthesis
MRIALVDNSKGWGGAEEMLFSLAKGLSDRGHYVALFLREGADTVERFVRAGFEVWAIPRNGLGVLRGIVRMIRIVRSSRFDLIHIQRNHDLPVGKIAAVAAGVPLLLTQHCLSSAGGRAIWNLADRIVTVSGFIAGDLVNKFPALRRKTTVIHNGTDLEKFAGADRSYWRSRPDLAGKRPLLGVVGYFYKNQEELIELLPRIRAVFPDVALIVIGRDDQKQHLLEQKAADTGVADAVYFAGEIPHDEMKHALAGLDLNVSAFRREGFGLSVIEGMAVGTPFVGYRAGGYPEIVVSGENGYLVENADEFVAILRSLLSDREQMVSLDNRSRIWVQDRFSLDTMVSRYETLYAGMLKDERIDVKEAT